MALNESAAVKLEVQMLLTRYGTIGVLGKGRAALNFQRLYDKGPVADTGVNLASFVETAGVTYSVSAGILQRNAAATTRTEQGALKTFHYLHGLIVFVDPVNPSVAASGDVTVACTGGTVAGGTTSTPFALKSGVLAICEEARLWTGTITLGFAGVTNKKANVIIIGSDNP